MHSTELTEFHQEEEKKLEEERRLQNPEKWLSDLKERRNVC